MCKTNTYGTFGLETTSVLWRLFDRYAKETLPGVIDMRSEAVVGRNWGTYATPSQHQLSNIMLSKGYSKVWEKKK